MDVLAIVAAFAALTAVVAGTTFVVMRGARRHVDRRLAELEPGLRAEEAETGRCGACHGAGSRMEVTSSGAHAGLREMVCYRCHRTGAPMRN